MIRVGVDDITEKTREQLDELVAARRFADAHRLCDELLVQAPDDLDLLYVAGMLAIKGNVSSVAARYIFRILELAPNEAPAYFHLGEAYLRQMKFYKSAA